MLFELRNNSTNFMGTSRGGVITIVFLIVGSSGGVLIGYFTRRMITSRGTQLSIAIKEFFKGSF
ncbi:MAG TPA: hypothetical protein GXX35_02540 [Thermoanaerobacterales bacterium]|nr:hypothetical protein [Thermoanaerobacterales bacterium]